MSPRAAPGRSDLSSGDAAGSSVTVRRAEPKDAPLVAATRAVPSARRARPEERQPVLAVLQSAFQDDPLYRWLYPDTDVRAAQLRPLFDLLLDAASSHDAVWVLDDLSAAAVYADHPIEVVSTDVVDRYVEHLRATLGPSRTLAATDAMAACDALSPSAPHDVLHSLAVPLHARGSGAGSALLGQLLDRCDPRGGSVYLESSNPRNLSLYRRHGFRPLGTVPLPGSGSRMTPMLRVPTP